MTGRSKHGAGAWEISHLLYFSVLLAIGVGICSPSRVRVPVGDASDNATAIAKRLSTRIMSDVRASIFGCRGLTELLLNGYSSASKNHGVAMDETSPLAVLWLLITPGKRCLLKRLLSSRASILGHCRLSLLHSVTLGHTHHIPVSRKLIYAMELGLVFDFPVICLVCLRVPLIFCPLLARKLSTIVCMAPAAW